MKLNETQDKEDILILLMINERDKQIELLEKENTNIKKLLIESTAENTNLRKRIKELNRRHEWQKKKLRKNYIHTYIAKSLKKENWSR